MPEGHLIHRAADDHQLLVGHLVNVRSPDGRFTFGAEDLDGHRVRSVEAWGKHLLYQFDRRWLHIHLGLEGRIRRAGSHRPGRKARVSLTAEQIEAGFQVVNPLRCELMSSFERRDLIHRLGPDPLRPDADPERAWNLLQKSSVSLGEFMLDQRCIAGVGNIYRTEILFLLRIHPRREARSLSRKEFDSLWTLTRELLEIGRTHNQIITADPRQKGKPREQMRRSESLLVYRRRECPVCGALLDVQRIAHRPMWFCERCQRK